MQKIKYFPLFITAISIIIFAIGEFFLPFGVNVLVVVWVLVPTALSILSLYLFRLVSVRNIWLAVLYSGLILIAPTYEIEHGAVPSLFDSTYAWHWFSGLRGPFVQTVVSIPLLFIIIGLVILTIANVRTRRHRTAMNPTSQQS